MSEQMDKYINSYAPELQAIIRTLREIAKKSMPAETCAPSLTQAPIGKIWLVQVKGPLNIKGISLGLT